MLSRGDLLRVFPAAKAGYINALQENSQLLAAAGLDKPLPLCMFLARGAAETAGLSIVEENGNYSAERLLQVWPNRFSRAEALVYAHKPEAILNRAYARKDLGNRGEWSGDGFKYRGRNLMQTTGAFNYAKVRDLTGADVVSNAGLLSIDFTLGLRAAVMEWEQHKLSALVLSLGPTHAAVLKVARAINTGNPNSGITPNGFVHQKDWFAKLWGAFGTKDAPALDPAADGILEDGEEGEAVADLQRALARLGFVVGDIDGRFGPRTEAAVAALQMREGLGGAPGKWEIAWAPVLSAARPFVDDKRRAATETTLTREGNAPVTLLRRIKQGGAGLLGMLGLDEATGASSNLPDVFMRLQTVFDPISSGLRWMLSNRLALYFGGAVLIYYGANWFIQRFIDERKTFGAATGNEETAA